MADTIDWPPQRPTRRGRGRLVALLLVAAFVFSAGTSLSYYVEALWFSSLGYVDVFWKTLNLQGAVFIGFAAVTFILLYGSFLALKPANLGDIATGGTIIINGQPVSLPVEPVLRLIGLGAALLISVVTGFGMMSEWPTLALYWYGRDAAAAVPAVSIDPIFGRPLTFYLFTLPALNLISGWLTTLAVMACGIAIFFIVIGGGTRALARTARVAGRRPAVARSVVHRAPRCCSCWPCASTSAGSIGSSTTRRSSRA